MSYGVLPFDGLAVQSQPARRPLLICCSPDCLNPALVADQLRPDSVQLLHTPANLVPPCDAGKTSIERTIADAVLLGGARSIIVCGHEGCGKLAAAIASHAEITDPRLAVWVRHAEAVARGASTLPPEDRLRWAVACNVSQQLIHLRTHPAIAAKLATGDLRLSEWIYDPQDDTIRIPDPVHGRRLAALDSAHCLLFRRERIRAHQPTPRPTLNPRSVYLA